MKQFLTYITILFAISVLSGCKKDNYPGGVVSDYISLFDVRDLYRTADVTLTLDNMFGATKIAGVVVSDHSGGNMPAGIIVLQDNRRLNQLRGIAINIGATASSYVPGDSLEINVEGKSLGRVDGILQIKGVTTTDIKKIASGIVVTPPIVKADAVVANPGQYESTLLTIAKIGFDQNLPAGTTYAGEKLANDGFATVKLHTEPTATFANNTLPFLSNYTGIIFNVANDTIPRLWPRTEADITILSAVAPKIAGLVITGYLADPTGTDQNYEYIQLMATRDIDFSVKNHAVVTTNNAGANVPTGFPTEGWATGGARTYKFNITSGTIQKGQYLYVGANKNIWGGGSTDISSSKWVSKLYTTLDGDGFGTATTNLLANSGNAAGISVWDLTNVTKDTVPVDVIFYGGNGSVYTAGPPEKGYKITDTDFYDKKNPSTQEVQPYFNMGSNTTKLSFPPATNFTQLRGTYNTTTGRWSSARSLNAIQLTATSTVVEIEGVPPWNNSKNFILAEE